MPGKKQTDTTVDQRIEHVVRLRLGNATLADIRQFAAQPEQCWRVCDRQLKRYIRKADELILASFNEDRERLLREHVVRRDHLYRVAMQQGNVRDALAVLKDLDELMGLYPAKRTELTGKDGGSLEVNATLTVTDEQRDAAIHSVMARLGQGRN